jgi:hypothetical protein
MRADMIIMQVNIMTDVNNIEFPRYINILLGMNHKIKHVIAESVNFWKL